MNDFETIIPRENTNCLKWDLTKDELPMWVADMDFKAAPPIYKALNQRAKHGIYGYNIIPDALYESYIKWWDENYNLKMKKEELTYSIGVMPSISSIIRKLTKENDEIVIQTPVYHIFFKTILKNNRKVIENKLIYKNGKYSIDFKDLDEKLKTAKMIILCNPHNPIGKTWSKEDLTKIGELCNKHNVIIVADEIHCDLTDPQVKYNSFANLNYDNITITCLSPSKTFNIAGLQSSVVHTRNKEFLEKINEQLLIDENNVVNCFAVSGTIAAYNESKQWLDELKIRIYENKLIVKDFLEKEKLDINLIESDATYLLWLNIEKLKTNSKEFSEYLRKTTGLYLSPGIQFGDNGDQFLRMNIACPEKLLLEGLEKLKNGTLQFKQNN